MKIYSSADADLPPGLAGVLEWIAGYLTAPHPELGRSGAVCPFVGPALRVGTLYLVEARLSSPTAETIDRCLGDCRRAFTKLPGARGRALIISFPGVGADEAPELLGGLLRRVKPEFVDDGLMLGPVYPRNEIPGAHNPAFRPMAGPLPLVAIRQMMETDLPFLTRPADPPEVQAQYLGAYLRHVGPHLSPKRRARLEGVRR